MVEARRYVDLEYDHTRSNASALELVLSLSPEWRSSTETIEFVHFKDGITNTLLKAINKRPGLTAADLDREAILIRAYGTGTQVLIDRDREYASHSWLSQFKLAPPLLARFRNGLMYRFIPGQVCQPHHLRQPAVWRAVAQRLAEWHARMPISAVSHEHGLPLDHPSRKSDPSLELIEQLTPGKPSPNIWGVMQKWIFALPEVTPQELNRKISLQSELEWLIKRLRDTPGVAGRPFVFGHCDLLSANVIILPEECPSPAASPQSIESISSTECTHSHVNFIDYEYATPCPAAFDLANHFAEWGGFECDFSVLPTRSQRRDFLSAYLSAYDELLGRQRSTKEIDQLMAEVDEFRGAPGLYWGIWALIQAQISKIDFDYANYAEIRLSEYWAWKATLTAGAAYILSEEAPLRERRWATEQDS